MRHPITVPDDHARAVRARFLEALERGKTTEEATRIANFAAPNRDPVELPPMPADLTVQEAPTGDDQPAAETEEAPTAAGPSASLANLDRDGDGAPGGSLPADQQGDEIRALRAEAEAKGLNYDGRWGAARLRKEIEAAS